MIVLGSRSHIDVVAPNAARRRVTRATVVIVTVLNV